MTNSAAIRVLYDLAGGRAKTWPALARDLDINVDDIYKRNRPWPSDFGRVRYCDAFEKYASEVHTTPYATLLAVRRSLQDSNAYTDEVKAIVDNVRADTEDEQVRASLERLRDTIIETARPYNEVERALRCASGRETSARSGADCHMEEKSPKDCAPQCGRGEGPVGEKALDCGEGLAGESPLRRGEGPAGENPAPACAGTVGARSACADGCCTSGTPEGENGLSPAPRGLTPAVLAAALAGAPVEGVPWYRALAGASCPEPACAQWRAVPGMPLDAARFLGAVLAPRALDLLVDAPLAHAASAAVDGPRDPAEARPVCAAGATLEAPRDLLEAAFAGVLSAGVRDGLVCALCDDEGLGCRTMLRRCADMLHAADAGAFFSVADFLLDHALPKPAAAADAGALDRMRSFYLRFGDGDPARCLFVLVLLALLGPADALRVVACPATHRLFERP